MQTDEFVEAVICFSFQHEINNIMFPANVDINCSVFVPILMRRILNFSAKGLLVRLSFEFESSEIRKFSHREKSRVHGCLEALEKIFLKTPLEPLVPLEAQNFSL